ncbi:MAG: OadG family protein [Muribaculaceae bacterium]|nr:OadG family protein [Muribaculaceae bacterium]MDE6631392.1 OadG family protein [Muribaculaceae bacterium]
MLKKYITLGILSLTLTCGYAQTELGPDQIDAPVEYVQPNGQEDLESLAVPSVETNSVEVSPTAKRMRQLEKAQNLKENDSFGGSLTLIAMCIVICALIILSLLFMGFGQISQHLLNKKKTAAVEKAGKTMDQAHPELSSGETIAAIGMALAEYFGQGHDIEHTLLTIHEIKKNYSPWNSKIYNLRAKPELHRNIRK